MFNKITLLTINITLIILLITGCSNTAASTPITETQITVSPSTAMPTAEVTTEPETTTKGTMVPTPETTLAPTEKPTPTPVNTKAPIKLSTSTPVPKPTPTPEPQTAPTSTPKALPTPSPEATQPANSGEKIFTLTELSKYNGQNGNPAYIAVDGIVYDVSNVREWRNGTHNGFDAGKDLTEEIKNISPHGVSKLKGIPVVGKLK